MNTIVFNKLSSQVLFEEKAKEVEMSSRNYLEVIDGQHPDLLSSSQTIRDNQAIRHRRSGYVELPPLCLPLIARVGLCSNVDGMERVLFRVFFWFVFCFLFFCDEVCDGFSQEWTTVVVLSSGSLWLSLHLHQSSDRASLLKTNIVGQYVLCIHDWWLDFWMGRCSCAYTLLLFIWRLRHTPDFFFPRGSIATGSDGWRGITACAASQSGPHLGVDVHS